MVRSLDLCLKYLLEVRRFPALKAVISDMEQHSKRNAD